MALPHSEEVREVSFGEGSIGLAFSDFKVVGLAAEGEEGAPGAPIVVTRVEAGQQAESFGVRAGDLIASLKGRMLSPDTTRDDFFEELVSSERPVAIGFLHLRVNC